jgi:phage-related protein
MTVSGTKTFELDVAEYIEEAFERCGIEIRTGYDQRTARRSLNLLLAEWANRGLNQWTIEQESIAVTPLGGVDYTMSASTIDILSAVCRLDDGIGTSSQTDLTIDRISRDYYLNIPNKLTQARPVQYFLDRQITPILYIWPKPDQAYTIVVDKLVRMDDASAGANTLEIPFRFYPCLAAGLAYYISMKRAPERVQLLKTVYEEEFDRAMSEDRDRAPLQLTPSRNWYRVT